MFSASPLSQFSFFLLVLCTNYLTIFLIASSQSQTTRPLLTSSLIDIKSQTLVTPAKSPSPYSQADTHFYNPHLLESWNNKEKDVVTGTWCRSLLTLEACYSLSTLAAMRIDIWPDSTPKPNQPYLNRHRIPKTKLFGMIPSFFF